MLPVTTLLVSILSLLFVWLSIQVIKSRRKFRVLIGAGGQEELEWAIRAQGNFAEYIPISLLLFACAELNKTPVLVLVLIALMLISGRLLHALGFLFARDRIGLRIKGMKLTFGSIIILSLWNIGLLCYQASA